MSHITIIINRAPHATSVQTDQDTVSTDSCSASVTYEVPHEATDAEVGQAVKKLFRQVRDLGN